MLIEGQRVEVLWNHYNQTIKKHVDEWFPGTFLGYCAGLPNEDFQRLRVEMDNGWSGVKSGDGAHPDCVRALVN